MNLLSNCLTDHAGGQLPKNSLIVSLRLEDGTPLQEKLSDFFFLFFFPIWKIGNF